MNKRIWGEVYKPVLYPALCKIDANMEHTEPFPFVPAIWMHGYKVSGLSKKDNNTKECILSMVETNYQYRNLQFCQKNITMFLSNIKIIQNIDKFHY